MTPIQQPATVTVREATAAFLALHDSRQPPTLPPSAGTWGGSYIMAFKEQVERRECDHQTAFRRSLNPPQKLDAEAGTGDSGGGSAGTEA